jgi:hypothetical protein
MHRLRETSGSGFGGAERREVKSLRAGKMRRDRDYKRQQ